MTTHDPTKHLLLCDQAHKRRIHSDDEFAEYVSRVRDYEYDITAHSARMEIFSVEIGDWPPVPRTPLQILFGINTDGTPAGPFADMPWTGQQLAVERNTSSLRATSNIAKDMVSDVMVPYRLAYQWQCAEFNPDEHVVVRYWCEDNGIDIADFLNKTVSFLNLDIISTTNPLVKQEQAEGSYSPTRRCFSIDRLHEVNNHYGIASVLIPSLVSDDSIKSTSDELLPIEEVTTIVDLKFAQRPNTEYYYPLAGQDLPVPITKLIIKNMGTYGEIRVWGSNTLVLNGIQARLEVWRNGYRGIITKEQLLKIVSLPETFSVPVPILQQEHDTIEEGSSWKIIDGCVIYTSQEIMASLKERFGEFRLFGGQLSDSKIISITHDNMLKWLSNDPTDRGLYVRDDGGGRNYDCDNFADTLRAALQREHGINCIGIIWFWSETHGHACNFFIVAGEDGPEVVIVEPQDDRVVTSLNELIPGDVVRKEIYL